MGAGMALINMLAMHESVRRVYSCETREEAIKLLTELRETDCAPDWPESFHGEEYQSTQKDIDEVYRLIMQTSDMSWASACSMLRPLVDDILPSCPDVLKDWGVKVMDFQEGSELAKNNPGSTLTRDKNGNFIVWHTDGFRV